MSCLIGHGSGFWDTILPPLQSLWERRDHHIVLPKVLCCTGPPSSIWVSCMSECIASARLLCNHGVLPWKDSRSWYMPLLSCAEVLRVGYSNLYSLLDKSILTLFKVVFQAGLFFGDFYVSKWVLSLELYGYHWLHWMCRSSTWKIHD